MKIIIWIVVSIIVGVAFTAAEKATRGVSILPPTVAQVMNTQTSAPQAKPAQHEPIVWTPEELRRLKHSYDEGTRAIEQAERERIERIEQYERRQTLNALRELRDQQSHAPMPVFCTHTSMGAGMATSYCY